MPGERQECGCRGDLEKGDRRAVVGLLAGVEHVDQLELGDRIATQQDALVETHQMRGDVALHAPPGGLEHGVQHGERRALAVGARDVHHGRQAPLGIAEVPEQALDALEREIDDFGV